MQIRGDLPSAIHNRISHVGFTICHRTIHQIFTAIYRVNTFQSFLGSTTATSASTAFLLPRREERRLITVQGRCCTQKKIKPLKVLTPHVEKNTRNIKVVGKKNEQNPKAFYATWPPC